MIPRETGILQAVEERERLRIEPRSTLTTRMARSMLALATRIFLMATTSSDCGAVAQRAAASKAIIKPR